MSDSRGRPVIQHYGSLWRISLWGYVYDASSYGSPGGARDGSGITNLRLKRGLGGFSWARGYPIQGNDFYLIALIGGGGGEE